jgi:cellulose synthase/poly-beta-1,6-N-acetylglucosamine synthase-like glycosyltransferase
MLWITSFLFLPCAIKAFCNRRVPALCLFSGLTTTSIIHHSSILPWRWFTKVDMVLAHFAGLWGIVKGIQMKAWTLLPLGLWSPIAFYSIEPVVNLQLADWIHATIHVTSSIAFYQLL